jgi:hypothetical protein
MSAISLPQLEIEFLFQPPTTILSRSRFPPVVVFSTRHEPWAPAPQESLIFRAELIILDRRSASRLDSRESVRSTTSFRARPSPNDVAIAPACSGEGEVHTGKYLGLFRTLSAGVPGTYQLQVSLFVCQPDNGYTLIARTASDAIHVRAAVPEHCGHPFLRRLKRLCRWLHNNMKDIFLDG